jgi:alkylation response protein AidB-like acyl-CoA dehydrogenase
LEVMQETNEIRALARQFAEERLRPNTEEWDAHGSFGDEIAAELAELGFLGMLAPESAGGMAFGLDAYVAVLEELAWGEAAIALRVANSGRVATALSAAIERGATDPSGLAGRLERIAAGESVAAVGEGRGARAAPIDVSATATPTRGSIELSGLINAVVDGRAADIALVPAIASEPLVRSRTLALVDAASDGWRIVEREQTLGLRPIEIDSVALDAVEPIGVVAAAGPVERVAWLSIAAIALGIARSALDYAREYADIREQFGRRIRAFEGIQHKLADMDVRVRTAGALLREAVRTGDTGARSAAAAAKLVAGDAAMWVATQAVQVYGGYGYMRDYPVEKLMRDAKAMQLFGDPSDVLRGIIAAELYRTD